MPPYYSVSNIVLGYIRATKMNRTAFLALRKPNRTVRKTRLKEKRSLMD